MNFPDDHGYPFPSPPPHSGVGITSFILSLLCGALVFFLIIMAIMVEHADPGVLEDEGSPPFMFLVMGILASGCGNLVGAILGFVSLTQHNRKNIFGIMGLLLNGLMLVGLGLLCVVGMFFAGF